MDKILQTEVGKVRRVDDKKRYWFIRTYSGEAYEDYLSKEYVGLGLNNIPFKLIESVSPEDQSSFRELQSYIEDNTHYKKGSATNWANQLIAFNHEISIGDTVIIPSKNSESLAIGTIKSNVFLVADPPAIMVKGKTQLLPEKRRRVKWERTLNKEDLQGDLRNLLASHQGVTNADNFSETIEGTLNSLFIKDGHAYLVIQIKQDEDINAFAFSRFLNGLTFFYKEFCKEHGIEDNEDLTIKIKVQSKGKTVLKALSYSAVIALAGLLILSNNSEVKADLNNMKVEGKSDGFLESLSDFLDRNQKRRMEWELFKDSIEQIKAERERIESLKNPVVHNVKESGEK